MSSLVGRYMGAAVGQSMSDVGGMMFREQDREEERERERLFRAEQNELARTSREEIATANREAKEKPEVSDDDMNELTAGRLGMSVPEVVAHRDAVRTGDESQFNFDEYPAGISPETIKAKRRSIYEILEQYQTGKDYKPLEEGRSEKHKRGLVDKAIAEPDAAPAIAQGVAAGAGKGAYGGNSDVVRNEFTGSVSTTDIGRARITNMQSDAKLDQAKIDEIAEKIKTGVLSKEDSDRLTTVIEKANSTIKSLTDNPPGRNPEAKAAWQQQMKDFEALRERARVLLNSQLDKRDPPTPGKPAPGAKKDPSKKRDYRELWNK